MHGLDYKAISKAFGLQWTTVIVIIQKGHLWMAKEKQTNQNEGSGMV